MDVDRLRKAYDYPIFPCPRCGQKSLALREASPCASFQCFECETILHGTGPFPLNPDRQPFPLVSYRRPQDTVGFLDLAGRSMASEIFPADFEEKALRRKHFREQTLRFGCQVLALGFILFALYLLIQFVVRYF